MNMSIEMVEISILLAWVLQMLLKILPSGLSFFLLPKKWVSQNYSGKSAVLNFLPTMQAENWRRKTIFDQLIQDGIIPLR